VSEYDDFNNTIINDFRSGNGTVTTMGFGRSLVLIHTRGAKSGAPRINPVAGVPIDDGWLIPASAGGSPKNPAWYHNLKANPDIEVEYPNDEGAVSTTNAVAVELTGDERDAAWAKFIARSPAFADYESKTQGRIIPVFHLKRA
jgi:deazaflavin-dependent oxidoreductase (nitroreductase family)